MLPLNCLLTGQPAASSTTGARLAPQGRLSW